MILSGSQQGICEYPDIISVYAVKLAEGQGIDTQTRLYGISGAVIFLNEPILITCESGVLRSCFQAVTAQLRQSPADGEGIGGHIVLVPPENNLTLSMIG